jgi:Polyketide cyclase / dehydrase and lipid transport
MGKYVVEARARSHAPPESVWEVLEDVPRWAEWGPWNSSELEREGAPPPGGVGAVRLLKRFAMTLREELTEFEPPARMAYKLLSGLPVRDYRAEVSLSPDGDSTELRWRAEFDALPGVGPLYRWQLQKAFEDITETVARRAEGG